MKQMTEFQIASIAHDTAHHAGVEQLLATLRRLNAEYAASSDGLSPLSENVAVAYATFERRRREAHAACNAAWKAACAEYSRAFNRWRGAREGADDGVR